MRETSASRAARGCWHLFPEARIDQGALFDTNHEPKRGGKPRSFDPAADTVKIVTMRSSKGLEFPAIAIPPINGMPHADNDPGEEPRILYVRTIRMIDNLVITGHECSGFFERLRG